MQYTHNLISYIINNNKNKPTGAEPQVQFQETGWEDNWIIREITLITSPLGKR
jgi:hypothetical protein